MSSNFVFNKTCRNLFFLIFIIASLAFRLVANADPNIKTYTLLEANNDPNEAAFNKIIVDVIEVDPSSPNADKQIAEAKNWLAKQDLKYTNDTSVRTAINKTLNSSVNYLTKHPKGYSITFAAARTVALGWLGYASFVYAGVNTENAIIAAALGATISGTTQLLEKYYTTTLADPTVISKSIKFFYKLLLKYRFGFSKEVAAAVTESLDENQFIQQLNRMKAVNSFSVWAAIQFTFLAPILAIAYDYPSTSVYLYTLLAGSFKGLISQGLLDVSISANKQKKISAVLENLAPGLADQYHSLSDEKSKEKLIADSLKNLINNDINTALKTATTTRLGLIDLYSKLQIVTVSLVTNSLIFATSGAESSYSFFYENLALGAFMTSGIVLYANTRWPHILETVKNRAKKIAASCADFLRGPTPHSP